MDAEQEAIQSGVKDALRVTGRYRRRLNTLSPVQREEVAQWIESKFGKLADRVKDGEQWLKSHPDDTTMAAQVYYWRVAVAVSRQLAYYARTQRTLSSDQQ